MQLSTGRNRRRLPFRLLLTIALMAASSSSFAQERPTIGVAFGGGSARGIAHVGVIRWFEEHHIPIDVAAGTSMGGLIGGSFATGMDAAAIQAMLQDIDWDQMFGFSNYAFKNIRRKADARAYPSRLEFGVKRGIVLPPSLNSGHQVDLLITQDHRGLFRRTHVRDAAHALQGGGRGPAHGRSGRAGSRIAGARDARHDVAPGRLSARRNRRPGAG